MAKRLVYFNELSIIRGFDRKIKRFEGVRGGQPLDFAQIYNKSGLTL